ncbi:hypothetical protein GQ53DRAFT_843709 [Thozetella sp. PMI_491]|nr:hypothetical protein GQ53DRAFT_843709 [Thozetella sp. PMI_491]
MAATAETIFLRVKPAVRPEDPSSEAGRAFLAALSRAAPAFSSTIWGRSVDKADIIGIGVELGPSGAHFPLEALAPFQAAVPRTLMLSVNATDLVFNPVTEIAILPLRETLTAKEVTNAEADGKTFGSALLAAPAPPAYSGKMALAYQSAFAAPSPRNRLVMLIGWREVQNHLDASETDVFQERLAPIMKKIGGDLDVTHFRFVAVETGVRDGDEQA